MKRHKVSLDESFGEALTELQEEDDEVEAEWAAIVKALETDPLFRPDSPPYGVEQDFEEGVCACQHDTGWCGWALYWTYKQSSSLHEPIEEIIVFAKRAPQVHLKPLAPIRR